MKITNWKVYDLRESIIACRNSMRTEPAEDNQLEFEKSLERAKKLVKCGTGSGEPNFLCGIRVSFDITYPQYWSMEAQRYHFLDIVCSSSKMHKLAKMDLKKACNHYVDEAVLNVLNDYIIEYNANQSQGNWMRVISNCPMGLELFERCSTNYLQLANIYKQRKHHKLEEWSDFCAWIEGLPYAQDLIIGDNSFKV